MEERGQMRISLGSWAVTFDLMICNASDTVRATDLWPCNRTEYMSVCVIGLNEPSKYPTSFCSESESFSNCIVTCVTVFCYSDYSVNCGVLSGVLKLTHSESVGWKPYSIRLTVQSNQEIAWQWVRAAGFPPVRNYCEPLLFFSTSCGISNSQGRLEYAARQPLLFYRP